MLLNRLRHVLHGRQRSQGLVEYGLITACLAFAGVAGFSALADAQKSYLTEYPKSVPAPNVDSTNLYHPTTFIHPPPGFSCNTEPNPPNPPPPDPWPAGWLIGCNQAVVGDTFSGATGYWPEGQMEWSLEDASNGTNLKKWTCTLDLRGLASTNQCSQAFTYSPAADSGKTLKLVVTYKPCTPSSVPPPGPLCYVTGGMYHFAAVSDTLLIAIQ